jgi:hypothetical protein
MSKRELRQILASGGLSLIATPKGEHERDDGYSAIATTPLPAHGTQCQFARIEGVKIQGVEISGVSIVETPSATGSTKR